VYEVFPVNYMMLSAERRDSVLGRFQTFLNSLPCEARIWVVKTTQKIPVGESVFEASYYRFFMESIGEPVNWLLEQCGFKHQPLTELPKAEPVKVFSKHMAMQGGRLMKTFTVYSLPGTICPGFISGTYGVCEMLMVDFKPLLPEEATLKMGRYMRLLRSLLLADQSKGSTPREEVRMKHDMATATYENLIVGNTRLFEIKITISVAGEKREELDENARKLRDILHGSLVRLDCPARLQQEMALGLFGKKLVVDTLTASAFFPFVSEDIVESPGGVFLGENNATGAPVILDPWLRMNQNILIMGRSGSGKSFLTKILLSRLASKNRNLAFYIIDPENEYAHVGRLLGAEVLDVTVDKPLGLDPVMLFQASKDTAAGILADIAGIDEPKTYRDLRSILGRSRDLLEVYQEGTAELKDKLQSFIDGPDSFLTMGKPQQFTNRMVFNLSQLPRQISATHEKDEKLRRDIIFQAANILLFSKIWQMLDDPNFLPLHLPKLVAVDEVWLYTATQASANFLEGVSRRGRKRNVAFLLASQRLGDVLETRAGKAVIENCATKILLRQDESAIRLVTETIGLSDREMDMLLGFQPGQGIIVAEDVHVLANFLATQDEYALFTTKPTERIV